MLCIDSALLPVLKSLKTDKDSRDQLNVVQASGPRQGLLGEVKQAAGSSCGWSPGTEEANIFQQVTCGKQNNRSPCWALGEAACSQKGHRQMKKSYV